MSEAIQNDDGFYQKQRIWVAALWQAGQQGVEGMALVLVAETIHSRRRFYRAADADSLYLKPEARWCSFRLVKASMMLRWVLRPLRRLSCAATVLN
ncbi:hypothetical protein WDV93_16780 [Pantoea ananatis]